MSEYLINRVILAIFAIVLATLAQICIQQNEMFIGAILVLTSIVNFLIIVSGFVGLVRLRLIDSYLSDLLIDDMYQIGRLISSVVLWFLWFIVLQRHIDVLQASGIALVIASVVFVLFNSIYSWMKTAKNDHRRKEKRL